MNKQKQVPVIKLDGSNEAKPIVMRRKGRKPSDATLALRERLEEDARKKCVEKNAFYIKWLMKRFKEADTKMIESMVRRERLMFLRQLGDAAKDVLKKEVVKPLKPFDLSKVESDSYTPGIPVRPDPKGDRVILRKRMEEDKRRGGLKDAVFYTDLIAERYLKQERTREAIGSQVRAELRKIKES